MRIQLVSDLHLEFAPIEIRNAGADILVLSGDICVADYLNRSEASPYYKKGQIAREFFNQISQEFETILYVMGNHEHYDGTFEKTAATLRCWLPSNIRLLDDELTNINGINIFGCTLWTNFDNNPLNEQVVQGALNDFRLVKRANRKMRASDTRIDFYKSLRYIETLQPDIVIGHHAPSYRSVGDYYKGSIYNPGYASHLDDFIQSYLPNTKLWTHGHMHNCSDYMIGNTRIVANPRGYRDENPEFNSNKVIEL